MEIELFKILVNTSLFVLAWIVQIVIYPGLCYYSEADLKRWHQSYSGRITIIVLPLMLSQLIMYAYTAFINPKLGSITLLVLVLLSWGITFIKAVPLHYAIDQLADTRLERKKLIKVNWGRTLIWTFILITSLINYGQ